jgi:hypothetical protein
MCFLAKQPPPPTLAVLQLQRDTFRAYYTSTGLTAPGPAEPRSPRSTPQQARPEGLDAAVHDRVRHDRMDRQGWARLLSRQFSQISS